MSTRTSFTKYLLVLFAALLLSTTVFASVTLVSHHCWRPDISIQTSPTMAISGGEYVPGDTVNSYIASPGVTVDFSNWGTYRYVCEDGSSSYTGNYFDLYNYTNQKILATNNPPLNNALVGPTVRNMGAANMCILPDNTQFGFNQCPVTTGSCPAPFPVWVGPYSICYLENNQYKPAGWYDCWSAPTVSAEVASGASDTVWIGTGDGTLHMETVLNNPGTYALAARVGLISPVIVGSSALLAANWQVAGFSTPAESPLILHADAKNVKITIGNPSMLVFGDQKTKHLNSFDASGTLDENMYFTVLNKADLMGKINSYAIHCSTGVTCTLDTRGGVPTYTGFSVAPNQPLIINAHVRIDRAKAPQKVYVYLDVNYSILNKDVDGELPYGGKTQFTQSTPTEFDVGLLDKQDFQIEAIKEDSVQYCVAADGSIGKTGLGAVPKVNIYFGGDVAPTSQSAPIIGMNECSPIDYNSTVGATNPNWVYCAQPEFLTQLGEHIGQSAITKDKIHSLEAQGKPTTELDSLDGRILNFQAYVREQDLNLTTLNVSLTNIPQAAFTNLGLPAAAFGDDVNAVLRLKSMMSNTTFIVQEQGVPTNTLHAKAGLYWVTIDMNELEQLNVSGSPELFLFNANTLRPSLGLKVTLNLVSQPQVDWFFYHDNNTSYYAEQYAASAGMITNDRELTNLTQRGSLIKYTPRTGEAIFVNSYAYPVIMRISGDTTGAANPTLAVPNFYARTHANFSYWTGFASSLSNGCETTSKNPLDGTTILPYRAPDINTSPIGTVDTTYALPRFDTVAPDSNVYFETVLYLPVQTTTAQDNLDLVSQSNALYTAVASKRITTAGNTLAVRLSDYPMFVAHTLSDVFSGVGAQKICVYNSGIPTDPWQVYWNQDKVIDDLNMTKRTYIPDSQMCDVRARMSS